MAGSTFEPVKKVFFLPFYTEIYLHNLNEKKNIETGF